MDGQTNAMGDGGMRLHEWVPKAGCNRSKLEGLNKQVFDEMMSTGAVIAGRGTFEPAEVRNGDHHGGGEIFIISRHEAPESVGTM